MEITPSLPADVFHCGDRCIAGAKARAGQSCLKPVPGAGTEEENALSSLSVGNA